MVQQDNFHTPCVILSYQYISWVGITMNTALNENHFAVDFTNFAGHLNTMFKSFPVSYY